MAPAAASNKARRGPGHGAGQKSSQRGGESQQAGKQGPPPPPPASSLPEAAKGEDAFSVTSSVAVRRAMYSEARSKLADSLEETPAISRPAAVLSNAFAAVHDAVHHVRMRRQVLMLLEDVRKDPSLLQRDVAYNEQQEDSGSQRTPRLGRGKSSGKEDLQDGSPQTSSFPSRSVRKTLARDQAGSGYEPFSWASRKTMAREQDEGLSQPWTWAARKTLAKDGGPNISSPLSPRKTLMKARDLGSDVDGFATGEAGDDGFLEHQRLLRLQQRQVRRFTQKKDLEETWQRWQEQQQSQEEAEGSKQAASAGMTGMVTELIQHLSDTESFASRLRLFALHCGQNQELAARFAPRCGRHLSELLAIDAADGAGLEAFAQNFVREMQELLITMQQDQLGAENWRQQLRCMLAMVDALSSDLGPVRAARPSMMSGGVTGGAAGGGSPPRRGKSGAAPPPSPDWASKASETASNWLAGGASTGSGWRSYGPAGARPPSLDLDGTGTVSSEGGAVGLAAGTQQQAQTSVDVSPERSGDGDGFLLGPGGRRRAEGEEEEAGEASARSAGSGRRRLLGGNHAGTGLLSPEKAGWSRWSEQKVRKVLQLDGLLEVDEDDYGWEAGPGSVFGAGASTSSSRGVEDRPRWAISLIDRHHSRRLLPVVCKPKGRSVEAVVWRRCTREAVGRWQRHVSGLTDSEDEDDDPEDASSGSEEWGELSFDQRHHPPPGVRPAAHPAAIGLARVFGVQEAGGAQRLQEWATPQAVSQLAGLLPPLTTADPAGIRPAPAQPSQSGPLLLQSIFGRRHLKPPALSARIATATAAPPPKFSRKEVSPRRVHPLSAR